MLENDFERINCFPTAVYVTKKPVFFERVNNAAISALSENIDEINDIYPVKMTKDISQNEDIQDFCQFVAVTALDILRQQGYDVSNKSAYFESMWCQEHHKHSMMEQHVHSGDIQVVGFYFLDTPKGCSAATFHDPRAGKVQSGRQEENIFNVTEASNSFNFQPEPGMLILTNSWLPHSFTRQQSDTAFRFIHFNIALTDNAPIIPFKPADEIV